MPSSQPTVAKYSCDSESKPSVGCDEGTVDSSLNEAPRIRTHTEVLNVRNGGTVYQWRFVSTGFAFPFA